MKLNVLLERKVFENYRILTSTRLDNEIYSVSMLETPDFENYIMNNSLILTTLYTLKNDLDLFTYLINVVAERNSTLCIKHTPFVNEISQSIIEIANQKSVPIIVLEKVTNLSVLFNTVHSELQSSSYLSLNFNEHFKESLEMIEKSHSTKELVDIASRIEGFEVLFYNTENEKIHSTTPSLIEYFRSLKNTENFVQSVDGSLYFLERIYYDDNLKYIQLLKIDNDQRHILYTHAEIFKIIINQIIQKKISNMYSQNHFLFDFITNLTSTGKSNQEMINQSLMFDWKIEFPIKLLIFKFDQKDVARAVSLQRLSYWIKNKITDSYNISSNNIKYALFSNTILYLFNDSNKYDSSSLDRIFIELKDRVPETCDILILESESIELARNIPNVYDTIVRIGEFFDTSNITNTIVKKDSISLMTLISQMNINALKEYSNANLDKIIQYDTENNYSLLETCYCLFKNKFKLKDTAEELFIHVNTLKYRISVLEKIGINISDDSFDYLPLYFSIYIHLLYQRDSNNV